MAARKRPMITTVAGAAAATRAILSTEIKPVRQLNENELVIFGRIVRSRETASWAENDIHMATDLAESLALVEDYTRRLKASGPTTLNERGSAVANPLLVARDNAFRSVIQLQRFLGLSASQKGIGGEAQSKRNAADRQARQVLEAAAEFSDLI